MKKIMTIMVLIIAATTLSSCGYMKQTHYDSFWEREKLTSNLHLTGPRAKNLLDRNLAECVTTVENRKKVEENTLNTKKCDKKDGLDWEAVDDATFLRQCMQRKGWIPSNCCAFSTSCSCD